MVDSVFTRLPSQLYLVSLSISFVSPFFLPYVSNSCTPTLGCMNPSRLDPHTKVDEVLWAMEPCELKSIRRAWLRLCLEGMKLLRG